jgi:hypothetical protein
MAPRDDAGAESGAAAPAAGLRGTAALSSPRLPPRRALVTAGCTWAGLAAAAALRAAGCADVLLFDRLPPLFPLEAGLAWCQGREAADPHLLAEALAAHGPVDAVVHLGAAAAAADAGADAGGGGGGCSCGGGGSRGDAAARRRIVEVGAPAVGGRDGRG